MATVHQAAMSRPASRLVYTSLLYVASVVAAIVFYRTVDGQPIEGIGSFVMLFAGPVIAVILFRRPPTILVPIVLFLPYYVVVALSIVSEYDESRWSYSRMEVGAFYLLAQLLVAWIAFGLYRKTSAASGPSL